jgi:hypothetical protein
MSLLPSLVGWQWAALAAVPIGIVLLYFLKLRRPSVTVPSTYLWSKTIEDLHVNSLLQRLRRSLLLFLQLLAVALAALALLRPGIRDEASVTGRKIFLLDASASMSTTDVTPDANRFERARRQIGEAIDGMRAGESAMLISFSDRADVLQSFTEDRRRLREALAGAKVSSRPTSILEALRAAEGLANPNRTSQVGDVNDVQVAEALPADLIIHSDGGFPAAQDFDLGNLKPTYVQVGGDRAENLAILAFSVDRNPEQPGQVQAFATVANLGASVAEATATLSLDGDFVDAERVSLQPGEETGVTFLLEVAQAASLRLALDVTDDLSIDDIAFAGIASPRLVDVLVVTPGNPPLDLALTTGPAAELCQVETVSPDYLKSDAFRARAEAGGMGGVDWMIFDRCAPEAMPRCNTFFIGSLPPQAWSRGEPTDRVLLVDIDRGQPIMRYLELYSLLIAEGRPLQPPPGAVDLMVAEGGPILSLAARDGYQDLVLGFEIISTDAEGQDSFNTDWHVQRSWPVFILNLLRHLAGAAEGASLASHRPGETVAVRIENPGQAVQVRLPDGQRSTSVVSSTGTAIHAQTDQLGIYEVLDEADRPIERFTVNLFDRRESEVAAVPSVSLGYESVDAVAASLPRRREFWRWLLLCVLGVMTLEWIVYAKRLG